jgi:hypothetical protein
MHKPSKLGNQRATPAAASKAAARLTGDVMSGADAVRAMTGGNDPNRTKIATAYTQLQLAIIGVEEANDLVRLRVAEYCEAIDQEIERLKP